MKKVKFTAILLILALIFTSLPIIAFGSYNDSSVETLSFVHTNDVHGYIDVEPYVKSVADALKEEYGQNNVITASAGDVFAGGQAIAHLTEGESIVDIMNAAGYDVMTFGNNDLNLGGAQLLKLSTMTNFPILAGNFFAWGTDTTNDVAAQFEYGDQPLASYEIFTTENGARVGVFGLTTKVPTDNPVYSYYYSTGTIAAAQTCVEELEAEDCDIIVALVHTGWSDDLTSTSSNDTNSYKLAMAVDGIDLVIDGHSHSIINSGAGYVCPNESETLIVQTGSFGGNIGIANINLDADHSITNKSAYQLSSTDNYGGIEPDEEVLAVAADWTERFNAQYSSKLAYSSYFLNAERTSASADGKGIRLAEQNLGNLITDALRYTTGADVAMFAGYKIRSSIEAGDITLLDLYNVFANGGTIYTGEITGAALKKMLASSISDASQNRESTMFNQISGLSFVYNSSTRSVVSVTMADGSELDEEAVYTIACESTSSLTNVVLHYSGYDELAKAVGEFLTSPAYDTENYAGPEGRIVRLSDLTSATAPEVTTVEATSVGTNGATLSGAVIKGSGNLTRVGFMYKTESGSYKSVTGSLSGENLTVTLEGLTDGTTYTYKAFAVTPLGYVYGEEKTFVTDEITSLKITSPAIVTLKKNNTLQLDVALTPSDASPTIVWSTTNPSVATVDENGLVTARAAGTVVIKATIGNGKLSSSVTIRVTA